MWLYLTKTGELTYQDNLVVNLEVPDFKNQQSITLFVDGETTGDTLNTTFNKLAKVNITQISVITERSSAL